MDDALADRVDALERAVTDGECEFTQLTEEADAVQRLDDLETQLEEIEDRIAELEAATQALRGYVGNIRSVNQDVEQRAETALAKAQSIEAAMDDSDQPTTATDPAAQSPPQTTSGEPQIKKASADGGFEQPEQQHTEASNAADRRYGTEAGRHPTDATADRCHACGQTHSNNQRKPAPPEQQSATTGQHSTVTEQQPIQQAPTNHQSAPADTEPDAVDQDENLLPEDTEETGTLQRVRELL